MVGALGEDAGEQDSEEKMELDTKWKKAKGKTEEEMERIGAGYVEEMGDANDGRSTETKGVGRQRWVEKTAESTDRSRFPRRP